MSEKRENFSRRAALGTVALLAAGAGLGTGIALGTPPAPAVIQTGERRRFQGKVVLITGATSGIGAAAAKMFAAEGGRVAFCGRRVECGAMVEQDIRRAGGEATYIRADVRVERDVKAFVDAAIQKYGGLDVCFNNAGITIEKPIQDMTAAEWDDVVNTDLRGNFLALKYEIPHLVARGGGVVVVTSSSNALATEQHRSAYTSAKRGLVGFVQVAAQELYQHNIRVNALIPGTTDTELVRRAAGMIQAPDAVWEVAAAQWAKSNVAVAHRMAKPEEIATFALTLASSDFPYMTGAQMVIDGGKTTYA
jgi:NAD(P)-dependent dehydrogenase (short-subunit alcohol dehydrogenase family)